MTIEQQLVIKTREKAMLMAELLMEEGYIISMEDGEGETTRLHLHGRRGADFKTFTKPSEFFKKESIKDNIPFWNTFPNQHTFKVTSENKNVPEFDTDQFIKSLKKLADEGPGFL